MATVFTETFINARITAISAQITAYETALTSLASGTVKSYTINTGQTTESVTKKDIFRIQQSIKDLIGLLQFWDDLLNNNGTVYARSLS